MKTLTTLLNFDPMYGYSIIRKGSTVKIRPTDYSNYLYYLVYDGCNQFAGFGYPLTSWDLEKMFGEDYKNYIN